MTGSAVIRRWSGAQNEGSLADFCISCQLPNVEKLGRKPLSTAPVLVWGWRVSFWLSWSQLWAQLGNCAQDSKLITGVELRSTMGEYVGWWRIGGLRPVLLLEFHKLIREQQCR